MMAKWLTAFILTVALCGNAMAGFPMHSGQAECGLTDCCVVALSPAGAPSVVAARLCCTLNCQQPGPTGPTGVMRTQPLLAITPHPAALQSAVTVVILSPRFSSTKSSLQNSHPAYIRHLALLI